MIKAGVVDSAYYKKHMERGSARCKTTYNLNGYIKKYKIYKILLGLQSIAGRQPVIHKNNGIWLIRKLKAG